MQILDIVCTLYYNKNCKEIRTSGKNVRAVKGRKREIMIIVEDTKKLEPGDKIHCQGLIIEVGSKIYYNEYFGEQGGFYCEFRDPNGGYHYWKQGCDGGYVEPVKK